MGFPDNSLLPTQATSNHSATPPIVSTAYLECGPLSLHQQIEQLGQQLQLLEGSGSSGCFKLRVLPLFLLPGVHVMEDIPAEVAIAQQALGTTVQVEICPYLGAHPRLRRVLTERMSPLPVEAWILLAHGSRRPNANQPIEALAEHLGAIPAYWSVSPGLESRLQELQHLGLRNIAILPYFLFPGATTDAIGQVVAQFSQQFPSLKLHLAKPLDASAELADLMVELAQTPQTALA